MGLPYNHETRPVPPPQREMQKEYIPRGAIRMEYGSDSCFIVPSLLKHTLPSDPVLQARSALFATT